LEFIKRPFLGYPMPVWKGKDAEGKEIIKVVGSYDELKELSGKELDDYHRPWIDDIKFSFEGVEYQRIDKVMDCWFESGSMPFAQFHYPFENKEKFEQNFPGDFIAEYVAQVRACFITYTLYLLVYLVKSLQKCYRNGNDSRQWRQKTVKSLGNFTDPNIVIDEYGADALRFLLLASPVLNGEDFTMVDKM